MNIFTFLFRIVFQCAHPREGKASLFLCKQEGRRAVEHSVQFAAGWVQGLQECSWPLRQAAQMNLAISILYYYRKVQQRISLV